MNNRNGQRGAAMATGLHGAGWLLAGAIALASPAALAAPLAQSAVMGQSAAAGAAAVTGVAQTIRDLVQSGEAEQGYALGQEALAANEGDGNFDFWYGLAALESGHLSDAVFALERVVINFPAQQRARLELGRAYYLSGNLAAARREFARIRAAEPAPPSNVLANVDAFLARIDALQQAQSRQVRFWVEGGGGSDSNINSATSDGSINTPFGVFDLVRDGREREDEFVVYGGGLAYSEPLSKRDAVDATVSYLGKDNLSSDTFDLGSWRGEAGWSRSWERDRLRLSGRAQVVTLDSTRFQHAMGALGTWQHQFDGWVGSATAGVTALRFRDDQARNTDQYLVALGASKRLGPFSHTVNVYGALEPAHEDGVGEHNGKDFAGLSWSVQYQAPRGVVPYVVLSGQVAHYDESHPVFGVTRDDDQLSARLGVMWQALEALTVRGEVRHTDVESNIPVFDYDRTEVEASIRYDL